MSQPCNTDHPRFHSIQRVLESHEMPTEKSAVGANRAVKPTPGTQGNQTRAHHRIAIATQHIISPLPPWRINHELTASALESEPNQRIRGVQRCQRGRDKTNEPTNLRDRRAAGGWGYRRRLPGGEVAGGAGAIAPPASSRWLGLGGWWTRKTSTATWGGIIWGGYSILLLFL